MHNAMVPPLIYAGSHLLLGASSRAARHTSTKASTERPASGCSWQGGHQASVLTQLWMPHQNCSQLANNNRRTQTSRKGAN